MKKSSNPTIIISGCKQQNGIETSWRDYSDYILESIDNLDNINLPEGYKRSIRMTL